jgi:hypothetical protein
MKTLNLLFVAVAILVGSQHSEAQSYVNFEGKQTNPIRLSPDGSRLFAVNTPDARVSVLIPVTSESQAHCGNPVGLNGLGQPVPATRCGW